MAQNDPPDTDQRQTGYISTYDERTASGFIRPADESDRLVQFHQMSLESDAENVLCVGQEVRYTRADTDHAAAQRWDVASSVEIPWAEGDGDFVSERLD